MPRKEKIGKIVSNKMDKTVVVAVDMKTAHPKYGKIVISTRRYKAHDESNSCRIGDKVRIQESRPYSKTTHWVLTEILQRAEEV
jgi:small subunit ribosomal protein S17